MMMKIKALLGSAAIAAIATTSVAYDLDKVPTREILGLVGPTNGAWLNSKVVATQPLEEEGIASLAGRNLRTRFWAIGGPDGIVPIHEHSARPAVFTVASGEIYEYSSQVDERILHKTNGLAKESGELAHWWQNAGTETVHLIAFDVQPVADDPSTVTAGPVPASSDIDLPDAKDAQLDLLGFVDIGDHFEGAYGEGWALSTYRVTIAPGGAFPMFTAAGEPAQTFLWSGTLIEHRSDTAEPVTLAERTGSNVANGVSAWWENTSDAPAVLYFGAVEPLSELEGIEPVGILAHGEH